MSRITRRPGSLLRPRVTAKGSLLIRIAPELKERVDKLKIEAAAHDLLFDLNSSLEHAIEDLVRQAEDELKSAQGQAEQ